MGYRISVDTGGTFTDVVVADETGRQVVAKAPTTPERIFAGMREALQLAGEELGHGLAELLAHTDLLIYGTTRALSPVMNCANIPVEVQETHNPVRVRRLELMPDTGGAGRWRGGCGLRKDIELLNATAVLSHLGDRHRTRPYGIFGGKPGAIAETLLNPQGNAEPLHSKATRELRKGDVVSFRLSGAGGYGPPEQRDPAAIAADIADGYVTAAGARRDYGWTG